jgi:hypothetical protein
MLQLVVGALLGFMLATLQGFLDRRRSRRSLASILLLEISWLEKNLHGLYRNHAPERFKGELPVGIFERHKGEVLLFSADNAKDVLWFYGLVDDVQKLWSLAGENEDAGIPIADGRRQKIHAKCYHALTFLKKAKEALEKEGAEPLVVPAPGSIDFSKALPAAPPRLFPTTTTLEDVAQ